VNIFRLSGDPYTCAEMHCDQHVVKMVLETAQMLSTAWRMTPDDNEYADKHHLYKETHKNHPSAMWVRHGVLNYFWTVHLLEHLCKEYTHRYNKHHASERLLPAFKDACPNPTTFIKFPIPFPQCMPKKYKVEDDPVAAYRNYYWREKARFAEWNRGRPAPSWWNDAIEYEFQRQVWDDEMQDFRQHSVTAKDLPDVLEG
jgi:hypothetical protein